MSKHSYIPLLIQLLAASGITLINSILGIIALILHIIYLVYRIDNERDK